MKKHIPTIVLMAVYILLIAGCLATFSSCSTVRKVFHKERSHRDSSVVTSRDSATVKHEESKENKFSIDSLRIEVQYDTLWLDTLSEPATEYSTPEGKMLSDVFKAARAGGKPKKIIISTGKIEQKSTEQKKDENTHVAEKKETRLSEKTMVIDKTKKKVSWGALTLTLLIVLLLIAIYKYRKQIWAFIKSKIKFLIPVLLISIFSSCAVIRDDPEMEKFPARLIRVDTVYRMTDGGYRPQLKLSYQRLGNTMVYIEYQSIEEPTPLMGTVVLIRLIKQ